MVLQYDVAPFLVTMLNQWGFAMNHALQVNFLRVLPSEDVVALAAAAYRDMHWALRGASECLVALTQRDGPRPRLVQASVQLHVQGKVRAEALICHRVPRIALKLALAQIRAQLGILGDANGMFHRPRAVSA